MVSGGFKVSELKLKSNESLFTDGDALWKVSLTDQTLKFVKLG
jgi:hypothetical protein